MHRRRSTRHLGNGLLPLTIVAGMLACSRAPAPPPLPDWTVIVRSIDAPAGGDEPGAVKCAPSGDACEAIAPGAVIGGRNRIHTARGAHAVVDLGNGVTVEMAGLAEIALGGGEHPGASLTRGTIEIEAPAAPERSWPWGLSFAGRSLAVDPAAPASIALRAAGEGRGFVTVRRGRVSLGEGADRVDVRSGETARIDGGGEIQRGIAAALEPDLGGDKERRIHEEGADAPASDGPRAGLGTMTARVPGTTQVVSGVHLASHKVNVVIHDGLARTEIEEVFANDTARVLEGRFVFPVPPDASISRLALWVGDDLVEGEIVERERAAQIFRSIVEDTVRPRDPALLEWATGSEMSLKIFPIPAHGSRKVVLAYDQAIAAPGGRARYVYPLSLGADRATRVDDLQIRVSAQDRNGRLADAITPGYAARIGGNGGTLDVSFEARGLAPVADFVLSYDVIEGPDHGPGGFVPAAFNAPANAPDRAAEPAFVAVRVPIEWPADAAPPARARRDRAVVIDTSHSQSKETLAGEVAVAEGLIWHLDPDERFVLLACDSACATFPEDGLSAVSPGSLEEARAWLRRRAIGGSSDVAGALASAARRLDPSGSGQIVYLGDGAASSGELRAETIAARLKPEIDARAIDLRVIGAGRTLDEVVLEGLARALGGSYERLGNGEPLARRVSDLALGLRSPVLRDAAIDASGALRDVYPRTIPNLRVGQELLVVGRMWPGETAEVRVRGSLGGAAFAAAKQVTGGAANEAADAMVPRIWAAGRIAELQGSADPAAAKEAIALSKQHHVMSRRTALLVLENDRMFADFGIERTQRGAKGGAKGGAAGGPRATAQQDAAEFGMIGLLRSGGDASGGMAAPLAAEAPSIPFSFSKQGSKDDFGAGGLGLSGIGEGGGGRGEGIGLGSIGTLGKGAGTGTGQGFGSGHGRLGGSHRESPPRVRMGATEVSGRLPPEVIQRIVRQNFGRFRLCYENGLRANPNLQGMVAVRFVIGRDGSVTNVSSGGGSLPDSNVTSCVVNAFRGLTFPAPDGGLVTVTYPIVFTPGGGNAPSIAAPSSPRRSESPPIDPSAPVASHHAGNDRWMTDGEGALDGLRKDVDQNGASRQRHEGLVRGLLSRGRFAEALVAARRFADLDPDAQIARDLLAAAAAATGDAELARTALDAGLEASPRNADLHARAARAFEAAGDEARACAHWRSLVELRSTDDDARYQAWRCRARLGDRNAALREAELSNPGKRVASLLSALRAGATPAYEPAGNPGELEAKITCADGTARCPALVVVTPKGDVVSPWTPQLARSGDRSIALSSISGGGTYRTLLVGGSPDARGKVELRALRAVQSFAFAPGAARTVAVTSVTSPMMGWGFGRLR